VAGVSFSHRLEEIHRIVRITVKLFSPQQSHPWSWKAVSGQKRVNAAEEKSAKKVGKEARCD